MTGFIFDCDGVLIDSEPLSVAELGRTLREAGAGITDASSIRSSLRAVTSTRFSREPAKAL